MSYTEFFEQFHHLSSFHLFCIFVRSKIFSALEHILYFALVYTIVCLSVYKLIFICAERATSRRRAASSGQHQRSLIFRLLDLVRLESFKWPTNSPMERVLIITSHPDDECMFFGPVIHSIVKNLGSKIYVLCLSHGNYEKQGPQRRQELWEACRVLGIPDENITLISSTHLPDDPNCEWKVQTLARIISNTIDSLDIQAAITFDRDGVSQHPNHSAVYYATASLCLNNLLPKDCKLFTLDSINTFRKYISLLDLILTCLLSTHWCVLSFQEASRIRNAMKKHESQMKWFRWLYIFFSRYMFINSLREMTISDIELEMQIQDSN